MMNGIEDVQEKPQLQSFPTNDTKRKSEQTMIDSVQKYS